MNNIWRNSGPYTTFYPNGTLKNEGCYYYGITSLYDNNGNIKKIGNSQFHGTQIWFNYEK